MLQYLFIMTRSECEEQVKGYTGAKYKKFNNRRDADSFIGLYSKPLTCPSTLISTLSTLTPKPTTMKSEGPELEEKGWDVVYSDGACKGNGKPGSVAGIGVWSPDFCGSVSSILMVMLLSKFRIQH